MKRLFWPGLWNDIERVIEAELQHLAAQRPKRMPH
jgi:hypothetical protein